MDIFYTHQKYCFLCYDTQIIHSFVVYSGKKHVTLVANRCVAIVIDDSGTLRLSLRRIPDGWWMQINSFSIYIVVFVIQKGQGVSNIILFPGRKKNSHPYTVHPPSFTSPLIIFAATLWQMKKR